MLLVAYAAVETGCVSLPISGFIFNRRGKTGLDLLLAWLPPADALLALAIPPSY